METPKKSVTTEKQTLLRKAFESLAELADMGLESDEAFSLGFMAGQAEKVFTGVCKACMFRKAPSNLVEYVRHEYGLVVTHHGDEAWLSWPEVVPLIEELNHIDSDPAYHVARGLLCGISNIDPNHPSGRSATKSAEPESGSATG